MKIVEKINREVIGINEIIETNSRIPDWMWKSFEGIIAMLDQFLSRSPYGTGIAMAVNLDERLKGNVVGMILGAYMAGVKDGENHSPIWMEGELDIDALMEDINGGK